MLHENIIANFGYFVNYLLITFFLTTKKTALSKQNRLFHSDLSSLSNTAPPKGKKNGEDNGFLHDFELCNAEKFVLDTVGWNLKYAFTIIILAKISILRVIDLNLRSFCYGHHFRQKKCLQGAGIYDIFVFNEI